MSKPPPDYLEVTEILTRSEALATDAQVEAWWDQWYDVLTSGTGGPTGHGYSALRELCQTLGARERDAYEWKEKTSLPQEIKESNDGPGWMDPSLRRALVKDLPAGYVQAYRVPDMVNCGLTWREAEDFVLWIGDRRAERGAARAEALSGFVELFEDYGVCGTWSELRRRYPPAYGRLHLGGGLPPFKVPTGRDWGGRMAAHTPTPDGPAGGYLPFFWDHERIQREPEDFRGLFPQPPPDGVKPLEHERAVAIGSALIEHLDRYGELPDFAGKNDQFLAWAGRVIFRSPSTAWDALTGAGIAGPKKSGVAGAGLLDRMSAAVDYARRYGLSSGPNNSDDD